MTDLSGDDSSESQDPLLTDRFEYAVLADGSHGVVRGSRRAFTRCEDELIHIPGAIQAHGMLVALKRQGQGVFIPRIVSENSHYICHYQPAELFGLDNFNQVMPIYQRSMFNTQMKNVYSAYEHTKASGEPIVFDFAFFDPAGLVVPCWCAAHYLPDVDLFVCEFELQDYSVHPLASPQQSEPPNPIDTLGSDHMDLATVSSMHSRSQPVFISPEFLHQGADSISTSVEVVGIATKIQRQLSNAADIQALLDAIVGVVKELTRFSRVMIYQFDEDYNGTVVAELMDPKVTQDVYRGLHFPAADIPPQARRLYMINKVRVLFDREHETSRLVGRDSTDIRVPLDLTHAYLRAMSPVHLKYLANMEVRSSMSMSLESEGKLWGLIVCHSYGATATQVPFSIRELCYFIGVAASTCIEKLLNADKLQARRIVDILDEHQSPNECITASSDELLKLFEADCGFLVIEGEARTIGRLTSYTEAVTLLKYLFIKESRQIQFSSNIKADFRDLVFPSGFRTIAGVLYIPLSGTNNDCVVFYRKSQLREVHWAGKPSLTGKIGNLEPRNSFKKWTQVVAGTSKGWTQEQANMAAMAQLVYGSFIRVWREKETAVRETRLKRLLLHDASHQVRTPLNAVINYLEMALEKPLEETTKHALTSSYTASKSLIYVIDDLLNLTGSTTGSIPQLSHPFDVSACIEEALEPLKRLAREKGIEVVLGHAAKVSRYLRGDPPSLQRTISVLVANAIEQTNKGKVLVEWSEPYRKSSDTVMRIAVTDSGRGLSERDLDDMFQEFEQVPDEDFDEDSRPIVTRRDDVLRVGVGLAFVARYVKQRNGQLRVTSTKGKGSTFAIEIPFVIASRAPSLANRRDASPLPTLPMPPPPAVLAAVAASAVTVTPSGSSRSGVGMSPPIVAQTPSISPLDTAEQTPTTHYLNIIVADDNIINVQILERRLSKMGHRVLVSRDGQECYNTFAQNHATVDFVLMDLNMPVVDGWLSTRMIREHENKYPTPSRAIQSCGRTPIFAVSGMLRRNDEQRCMSTGFDGWMPKPVDMKRLAACLAGALDPGTRNLGVYDDAHFELGGWFPQIVEVGRFVSIGAVGGVAAGAASEPGASSNVATESLEEPPYTPATTTATVLGTIPETMESEASTSLQPQPQPQPTVAGPSTSPAESMAETARAMSPEARYHEAAVAADAAYQSYLQETWSEPDPDPYQGDEAQRGAGGGGGGEADVDPYSVWLGISNAPRTI
ncbi:phytochrome-like protein [Cercophora scortea]|uniref:Phytochrome-like protein n=1 Tax=Cercophora scortea TaxID=314031 RepID=A0AAE0MIX1_9PEZI|nr:phytochrome-like protein [Cercophora scortea]